MTAGAAGADGTEGSAGAAHPARILEAGRAAVLCTRRLLPGRADLAAMRRRPRRDILAGLTVAIVALPLALGFGISSGLGAGAGLVTAVIAGILAAVFGGSNLQVSGPTGAMTVVLVPIVAAYGGNGVLVVGILAGLMLVGLAYAGAGRYMRYIPLPVVEGFTVGIAVIIALQQVPAVLGVQVGSERVLPGAIDAVAAWLARPDLRPVIVAAAVTVAMLLAAWIRPGLPVSLVAVVVATVAVAAGNVGIATIGDMPAGLPAPSLPAVPLGHVADLVVPAVAVAALAALESLMSATVADGMRVGERHDSDRELFGQGVANVVTPLFGGIPATAAIARTAVNVRSGAGSRLAAITQSVALLAVVLVASRWVGAIPLAALAGVLVATAIQMVEASSLVALLRSTRGDAAALVITAGATILLDLVTAVILGLVVAGAFALQQMARSAHLDETDLDHSDHSAEEEALFDEHIVAYRLDGPLFFGVAHTFLIGLAELTEVRVVILRMSRVATLDATGASVLADTIKRLESRGTTVLLSGIRPEHEAVLARLGVFGELGSDRHVFEHTPDAIAHARTHARRLAHGAGDPAAAA
jgi:MFS superfamily sulfate permease-like transporter